MIIYESIYKSYLHVSPVDDGFSLGLNIIDADLNLIEGLEEEVVVEVVDGVVEIELTVGEYNESTEGV